MKEKIYFFTPMQTLCYGIVLLGINLLSLVLMLYYWFFGVFLACTLLLTCYFVYTGTFFPICFSEKEIKYRKKAYEWKDIKITAYPEGRRSVHYAYVLYFGTTYFLDKKSLKANKICGVYLNAANLDAILKYYKYKILVVNANDEIEELDIKTSKKLKTKIEAHNRNFK